MSKVIFKKKESTTYRICQNCGARIPDSRGAKAKFCSTTCCQLYHGCVSGSRFSGCSRPIV